MARTPPRTIPFYTQRQFSNPTNGATTGLVPSTAPSYMFELAFNTSQVIIHNQDAIEDLYFMAWNSAWINVPLSMGIKIAPGSFLTLALGVRSDRVGDDFLIAFNTSAATTSYSITEIYSVNT